jgi:hypothetical protein
MFLRLSTCCVLLGYMSTLPAQAEVTLINVDKACASIVGIPYASDNFTDEEWQRFQQCRSYLNQFAE